MHLHDINETTYHDPVGFRGHNITYKGKPQKNWDYEKELNKRDDKNSADVIEQHKRLERSQEYIKNPHFYDAIKDYTGYNSKHINGYLTSSRDLHPIEYQNVSKIISHLEHGFKTFSKPLEEDVHVYSGLKEWRPDVKEGDIFHTPAYISSSINPQQTHEFTHSDYNSNKKVVEKHVLHFHLPKGFKNGLYLGNASQHIYEREMLLNKGQKWKVTGIKSYNKVSVSKHLANKSKIFNRTRTKVYTVVPHDEENIQEAFIHNPNRVEDAIKGNHVRQLLDARLSSLVIPAHPKINKNSDEAKSLSNYSQSSTAVNNALIAKDNRYLNGDKDKQAIAPKTYQGIKRVFDQAEPLSHEQHVYSGTGHWDPLHKNKNNLIHTPAFTSTSHSISTARSFAAGGTIIHFHLPKGYNKAINMRHHSEHPFEKEVLLDHGQTWKIHAVQNVPSEYGGTVKVVTVKPHVENIKEAFEHNPNDKAFKNVNKQGIENFPLAKKDEEHKLLKNTHIVPLEYRKEVRRYGEGSSTINIGIIEGRLAPSGKTKSGYNDYFVANALRTHKTLLNMFQKHPSALTREHHVYSGLGVHDPSKFIKKDVFKMPAYTSTSTRPSIAIQHSNTNRFEETNTDKLKRGQVVVDHILHFRLPEGYTGGKYIQNHTDYDEHEMLLAPNQKWRVINKQIVTGKSASDIYGRKAHKVERHIWTVVPHEDNKYNPKPITEAFEHNPKTDLLRFTPTVQSMHWSEKHRNLVNNLRTDHENRTNEEHEALLDIHDHHSSDIKDYTQGSSHLNFHLISPHDSHPDTAREMDDMAHDVSHAIRVNTAPLERDHHVYSGITYKINPEVGKVVHTPAFTSTSIDINRAARFAQTPTKDILHFHLPKGYTKGIYVASNSDHPDEREFLLDHGQTWKVTNIAHHHNDVQMGKQHRNGNLYNKYRIISLKPHTENVNEATFHSTIAFRNQSDTHTDFTSERPVTTNKTSKHAAYQKMKYSIANNVYADSQDQHKRLKEYFSHLPHYSPITNYTNDSDSSKAHNKAAIAMHSDPTSLEPFTDEVHKLSNTIKEHSRPLPEDVHTYSGIKWDPRGTLGVGKTVHLPAFTSTTIDPEVSTGYTESHHEPAFDHMHYLHFHLPKGYNKGVYAAGVSQYHDEKEYLLDKGQTWKVTGHKKLTSRYNISTKYTGETYKHERKNYHHVWTLEPHDDK